MTREEEAGTRIPNDAHGEFNGYLSGSRKSSSVVGGANTHANHRICLWPFLALNDVEFHFVAFFQGFIAVELNRRVMHENIWPVITSDESVALGIVEPLNLTFELSHRLPPSLHREEYAAAEDESGVRAAAMV